MQNMVLILFAFVHIFIYLPQSTEEIPSSPNEVCHAVGWQITLSQVHVQLASS